MKQVLLLIAVALMCSVSSFAQPANDDCTGAYPIACGDAIADSTIGATVDSLIFCGTSNGTGGGVWYKFTGINSGDGGAAVGSIGDEVTLGTCNDAGATPGSADFDSKIRVYTGCGASLVCVGGNDDNSGAGCTAFSSLFTFDSEVGEQYYVLVHGFSANEGNFVLSMSCLAPPTCPEPSGLSATPDTATTNVLIEWTNEAGASSSQVKYGAPGFDVATEGTQVGSTTDTTRLLAGLDADTQYDYYVRAVCGGGAGNSVWVFGGTFLTSGANCGDGNCTASENFQNCPGDCPTPSGATCQKSITVNAGDTIVGAQILQGVLTQDTVCNAGAAAARWYKWTAPADGLLTIEAIAPTSGADTYLSLLSGGCVNLTCIDTDDDGGAGFLSLLSDVPVDSGTVYRVEWDDRWSSGGVAFDWTLSFALPPTCPNPSGLSVTLVDSVSATFLWTDNAGASNWEVAVDTAGFDINTATPDLVADTNYTASGLQYETAYDIYVRAICGGEAGNSEWIQGGFTTTAGPLCNGGSFTIYLPDSIGAGFPAVVVCAGDTIPAGYTAAADQACAEEVILGDSFCGDVSWDSVCQGAYDDCAATCEDGIQNGDETGIDCGGPDCPECPPCPDNELTLSVITDQWGGETTWSLFNDGGTAIASGGPYATAEGEETIELLCVPDGCYDFVMFDSFGDGMCCAFGNGSYALTLDGDTLASGGEFLDADTTNFCLGGVDCSVYDTAPVDLTKSFDPVNGVQDRVQVKWFKATPEVRYSDADAAACDIKFWPKRNLDSITGAAIGDPIIALPEDTVNINNAKKFQPDGVTPREIFKWPVKFRADGANNNKRADPNIRYQWQVRCACEHGQGPESPWSAIKIFNTPNFDPATGIYTPPEGVNLSGDYKIITDSEDLSIFPNPISGNEVVLVLNGLEDVSGMATVTLRDVTGKLVFNEAYAVKGNTLNQQILFENQLGNGLYMLSIEVGNSVYHDRLMVK